MRAKFYPKTDNKLRENGNVPLKLHEIFNNEPYSLLFFQVVVFLVLCTVVHSVLGTVVTLPLPRLGDGTATQGVRREKGSGKS